MKIDIDAGCNVIDADGGIDEGDDRCAGLS